VIEIAASVGLFPHDGVVATADSAGEEAQNQMLGPVNAMLHAAVPQASLVLVCRQQMA